MKCVKLRTVLYFALVTTMREGSASPSARRRFELPSALQSKSTMPRPLSMLVWLKPAFEVSQSPSTSLIHSGLSAVLAISRTIVRSEVP